MIDLDNIRRDPPRDRWGRYLVKLPGDKKPRGRTRVTTFIKALDQGDGLIAWKATATMVGALRNPGLHAKWAAVFAESTDPWYASDELKTKCKKLVDECADHGGAQSRADLGTALHSMIEQVARGEDPALVEPYAADVEAWRLAVLGSGLVPLRDWTEVCVYIEKYDLVGTFDGLFALLDGPRIILGDLKTETSTDYKALNHAAQLAAYSLATHRIIWPDDPDGEVGLEPLPDFDRETGLIIHLPAGEARCTLHAVDLAQGREALEVASAMRRLDAQRKRKDTGGLMRPWDKDALPGIVAASEAADKGQGPLGSSDRVDTRAAPQGYASQPPSTDQAASRSAAERSTLIGAGGLATSQEEKPWPGSTNVATDASGTSAGPTPPEPSGTPTPSTAPTPVGSVNPPTTTSETTFETMEGPAADPADITLAANKYDALEPDGKARVNGWLKEANAHPRECRAWNLGGGNHTTRRLNLVEASIAIAQEGWSDDSYRSLIAVTGHHPNSFTDPIGVLLGRMDHQQATALYQAVQYSARNQETSNG